MSTDLGVHDDLTRSASPPGRESRDDWRGAGGDKKSPISRNRARSRSPSKRTSPNRERRFARDGTNTMSCEPHMERARLFVGNIEPVKTQRRDLIKLFSEYGEVLGVSIHKGYAFVQMDRERSANKAVNYEDKKSFMGSKIHVEFSQAALKAGAKFERLPLHSPPPPRDHNQRSDYDDKEREERLARILQMEREIAMLRSREGDLLDTRKSRPDPPVDSYDRRDSYRRSPPQQPSHGGYQSYSRDHDGPYRGEGGGRGESREYYGRQEPPVDVSRGASGDSISYSQFNNGRGVNRNAPAVGYGGSGGGKSVGPNSPLPPGWPSDYNKSNPNRPPFAGPWT